MTSPQPGPITIDEAYDHLARSLPGPISTERLSSDRAKGRFLAEDVLCQLDSPPFDQSAMDGVAFAHGDGDRFRVKVTLGAGRTMAATTLEPGECVRIMTGAPIPTGADTVQMVEHTRIDGEQVILTAMPQSGAHIRYQGENLRKGDLLYPAGTLITPAVVAGLTSQGIRFVEARRKLRVGLATTGDEIVDFRHPLQFGQIHNSNGPGLTAALSGFEADVFSFDRLPDHFDTIRDCLAAASDLDVMIVSGGVSMGDYDHVPKAAKAAGYRQIFHKIAVKPGKPLWFGVHESGTLLFGLPGNPVSCMVGASLFIQPVMQALCGGSFTRPHRLNLPLAAAVAHKGRFPYVVGAVLEQGPGGSMVRVLQTSGSGDIVRFAPFSVLAVIPPTSQLEAGGMIEVLLPCHPWFR